MDYTETLRKRAAELLESGTVATVIAWGAGRFANQRFPLVVKSVQDCDNLICDDYCAQMIAKRVLEHTREGRVGLVARGCETRAINRFIADHQLQRDQVYIIGIPCTGMIDWCTGTQLHKCAECQHRNPLEYDEVLGAEVTEPAAYRFSGVDELEAMNREDRRAFFDAMYSSCIRCYACRNACPCCTCRECFVDQERVGWLGKQFNTNEARYFGVIRAFHTGDRCIECGECERVCPMGLPLMRLMHKQVRDIDTLFGPYAGGGLAAGGKDPLRTYRTNDVEEFM